MQRPPVDFNMQYRYYDIAMQYYQSAKCLFLNVKEVLTSKVSRKCHYTELLNKGYESNNVQEKLVYTCFKHIQLRIYDLMQKR